MEWDLKLEKTIKVERQAESYEDREAEREANLIVVVDRVLGKFNEDKDKFLSLKEFGDSNILDYMVQAELLNKGYRLSKAFGRRIFTPIYWLPKYSKEELKIIRQKWVDEVLPELINNWWRFQNAKEI